MKFSERLELATNMHEATFAICYNEAGGRPLRARVKLVRRLFASYRSENAHGLDPATIAIIFALIKLAIQVWKWAKDNGYLASYQFQDAPAMTLMKSAYHAGEYPETMAASAIIDLLDDLDDDDE